MSIHCFAAFVTPLGTAANNRGETDGNTTTLQKLIWNGATHTTVSAESIRFALRRRLADFEPCNRTFDENERSNRWSDAAFTSWARGSGFIDDDLLGFMQAEAAKDEGTKGTTKVRRAVLEVTRAVSLLPWPGDVTFNAASVGATPSASKKGANPVPYATEMHATRYQYAVAMTPDRLRDPSRAASAIEALCSLGPVAGNHGRFLFDFSPESAVFRICHDPAPRILYCFEQAGGTVSVSSLLRKVKAGDVAPSELIIAGDVLSTFTAEDHATLAGAMLLPGVRAAAAAATARIQG